METHNTCLSLSSDLFSNQTQIFSNSLSSVEEVSLLIVFSLPSLYDHNANSNKHSHLIEFHP